VICLRLQQLQCPNPGVAACMTHELTISLPCVIYSESTYRSISSRIDAAPLARPDDVTKCDALVSSCLISFATAGSGVGAIESTGFSTVVWLYLMKGSCQQATSQIHTWYYKNELTESKASASLLGSGMKLELWLVLSKPSV
jgi:hypothetical protein